MAHRGSDLGRFAEPVLLILISLAAGPKHGYAIMEDVRKSADVKIGPGTLYAALARLEKRGLIVPIESDDRRQPYQITAVGAQALRSHLSSMQAIAAAGLERLDTA